MAEQKNVRCAIYTRKSTDEGLDKEFNTLEAQREAGENYVRSQKHQGWVTTQVTNVQNAVAEQVAEATSQANRAEAATSSKANLDFSNIAPSASAKASIIAWIAPDWSRRQVLALNADVTISQYGWVLMRNVVYNSSLSG